MNAFRKTGVVISKKYHMLCGNCCRRFQKIMIVELTTNPIDIDLTCFDVPGLFNSTLNHECDCPFCFAKVQIILNESLLVGDQQQLDYSKTVEENGGNIKTSKNGAAVSTFKTETSILQTDGQDNVTLGTATEAPD